VHLNSEEIQALSIASRLLSRKIRFHYPSAASALRKLSSAVEDYAKDFSRTIRRSAEIFDTAIPNDNSRDYGKFINILTAAMVDKKAVRITYFSLRKAGTDSHILHPYHVEPYAEGNSLHVLGFIPEINDIRIFKFERIIRIELQKDTYVIPPSFNIDDFLKDAWAIWKKDNKPEVVELIFSAEVKHRVSATRWHRSEESEEQSGGRLLWKCRVSAPEEMVPWIRGWGADVVVLKPEWLRERIEADTLRTIENYRGGGGKKAVGR
jgi:CRISPR-associated endonuclease/helicase Cas3